MMPHWYRYPMEFYQFTKEEFCVYGLSIVMLPVAVLATAEEKGKLTDDMIKRTLAPGFTSLADAFLHCAARQAGIKENF
jgi:hypothetical protein